MMVPRIGLLAAGMLLAGAASAAEPAPVLVELFTSEGCSSCPPADSLAGELDQRDDVLVLSYHVNYWDYIGWKDRFATDATTARQHGYARSLRQRSVYTPEMVIGGVTHRVGSDAGAVSKAIDTVAESRPAVPEIDIRLTSENKVRIAIGAGSYDREADVLLVRFHPRTESDVRAGENAGRTLPSYNVVKDVTRIGSWSGDETVISLKAGSSSAADEGCAILVQVAGQGAVLGVRQFDMESLRDQAAAQG